MKSKAEIKVVKNVYGIFNADEIERLNKISQSVERRRKSNWLKRLINDIENSEVAND